MAAQEINAPVFPNGTWHHLCVTLAGTTGAIFVDGALSVQQLSITLNPSSLGANWVGGLSHTEGLVTAERLCCPA
jgi:hypothetical protein